ncbi:hypothetical protein [Sphingopyxis chilensis]
MTPDVMGSLHCHRLMANLRSEGAVSRSRHFAAAMAFATGFLGLAFTILGLIFTATVPMLGFSQKGGSPSSAMEILIALVVGVGGISLGLRLGRDGRNNAVGHGCMGAIAIPFAIWIFARLL